MAKSSKDIQLSELKDLISQLNMTIKNLNETIARQQQENDNLKAEMAWLKQKLFGSSSERRAVPLPGQMGLFDGEEEKPLELIEPEVVSLPKKSRKKKPTLKEQFENLPTKQVPVDTLSDEDKICSICGTQMVPIGTEVIRTEIVYTRPKLERIEYIATTYGCPQCKDTEEPQFIKDNGKPAFIEGSYVSESLLSLIAYQKYGLYLPLYRQEKDFQQLNAPISRSTMAKNLITAAQEYLQPMYDFFHRKLLYRRFLMMDETPVQVLKEDDRRAQTKSYFWVIRTGEDGLNPIILYNYTPTRAGENARRFLNGIAPGFYLMADGYQGYNKVQETNRCCCFAHIRRYLLESIPKGMEKDYTNPAVQGFLYCNKLFEYERSYREKGLSFKQIYNRRLKDQKPVIEAFLSWLDQLQPKSGDRIIRAINYSNGCRPYMMNYLKDGACSLSNNLSENSIRPLVVGRKNWLFSDTPAGADASMKIYSMIETAKANDLDPKKYLNYLLGHRPSVEMSDDELKQLAPWSSAVRETCK